MPVVKKPRPGLSRFCVSGSGAGARVVQLPSPGACPEVHPAKRLSASARVRAGIVLGTVRSS